MGKTNCGGNQHVHVQQQCDEWLNAATAAKVSNFYIINKIYLLKTLVGITS